MLPPTPGIHHVTAIASNGSRNLAFYRDILGMRLVKKTVNFDVPDTYHLYYGNQHGDPGTALTFFLWPNLPPAQPGNGATSLIRFAAPPNSLPAWTEHLARHNIPLTHETRFDEETLLFQDPDGLPLAIVERPTHPASSPPPIIGFDGVELQIDDPEDLPSLLESMGYTPHQREGPRERLVSRTPAPWGERVDLLITPDAPPTRQGLGAVHHVAFRATDDTHQADFLSLARHRGLHPSPVIDRTYFHSIYFREPNGILFEIATDGPGFTIDEPAAELGTHLKLPPALEHRRNEIERSLPPLSSP